MANFVEQATLKVNDQSSAAIRKINAELKKLERTAKSLKSIRVDIKVNASGLQAANKQLNTLAHNMSRIRGQSLNLRVNSAGITQAQNHLNRLRQQASRPININTRNTGGGGGGGAGAGPGGAGRRGLSNTGIRHQLGNYSVLRGAASVVIGGTAYAAAANVARTVGEGVLDSEDARMKLRQSGFDKGRKDGLTPQTDYIMEAARRNQKEFSRIPAAEIVSASVEQLNAIKANNGTYAQYEAVLRRVASNAQTLAMTYGDAAKGKEGSRQLERLSQNLGQDVDEKQIAKIHDAAIRAIVATGGEMTAEEMVRVTQQLGSGIAKSMSPEALLDIFMVREEGGRASTAEWRTAIQSLNKGEINKKDKAAQIKYGLRDKSGKSIPAISNAAASNFVKFTEDKIRPILRSAGKEFASSMEIAAFLDEDAGFSTTSARAYADVITSSNNKDLQRQRAAASYVDPDPHLGDRTFRGGSERLKASIQTAMGRALDKSGGAFTDAITPFTVSMDKAGKAAETGNYAGAAWEMTKGVSGLMGGPAGALITAMSAAKAATTLMDPTSTPLEKGAALLVTGSAALLTAAGAISNYLGGQDPNKDLENLQQIKAKTPDELAGYKQRLAAEMAKPRQERNQSLITGLGAKISALEATARTIDADIAAAQVRVDLLKKEQDKVKAEEEAAFDKLRQASQLGGTGTPPVVAPSATGPISAETVQALQQLNTSGGLAGVKSITQLLKVLNQPTSVKSREELATSLGYTGKLGGSAEMNTFLLNFFKKLATAVPEPPKDPAVTPPPPAVTPPADPPVVEPPKTPVPIEQPVSVTPTEPARPPGTGGAIPPIPPMVMPTKRSALDVIDFDPAKVQFASMFTSGASTIGDSGSQVGMNAAAELYGEASGIGQTIGSAAAAIISQATVNVNIPNQGSPSPKASTGGMQV